MRGLLLSVLLLGLAGISLAPAEQIIPNPNQDRLGMPPATTPPPSGNNGGHRTAAAKYLHAEALREAEELCTRAQQLRDQLKSAGDYVVPASAVADAQKIEKLAHKLRTQLKSY